MSHCITSRKGPSLSFSTYYKPSKENLFITLVHIIKDNKNRALHGILLNTYNTRKAVDADCKKEIIPVPCVPCY
jgi:hypothetical protein